jgi:hypothetical protein
LIQNLNTYVITKEDEDNSEKCEVMKVAKFYEMVFDKKSVGMPCRPLHPINDFVKSEIQLMEMYPLIQAYGLDIIGGGFFTMKHKVVNVRNELDAIYLEYDAFSKYRIVNEEVERLNAHYFDNFFAFNRDTI